MILKIKNKKTHKKYLKKTSYLKKIYTPGLSVKEKVKVNNIL